MSLLEHFSIDPVESSVASSYITVNQTLPGIYAMQMIPKNTITETFSIQSLICARILDKRSRVYCGLQANSSNILNVNNEILRFIKFSKDIQSNNAVFEWINDGIRLRITQDIAKDAEIVIWFTEEISLIMAIPFLSPINIRGNDCYMCHVCHKVFSTPHPLKVHLALVCDSFDVNILWLRLYYMKKAIYNQSQDEISEMFKESHLITKKADINNRLYGAPLSWTPQSAFKPITATISGSISTPATTTTHFHSLNANLSKTNTSITIKTNTNPINSPDISNFSILDTIDDTHQLTYNINSNLPRSSLQTNKTLSFISLTTEGLTSKRKESATVLVTETVTSNLTTTATTTTTTTTMLPPRNSKLLETTVSSSLKLTTSSLATTIFPSICTATLTTPFTSTPMMTLTLPSTAQMIKSPNLYLPLTLTPVTSTANIAEHRSNMLNCNTTVPNIDGTKQFDSHLYPMLLSTTEDDNSMLVDRNSGRYCSRIDVTDEKYASEMETIASNLGSSVNGHLCIFCGKVYSRKYGLKIHIRTHSGYKPLKCKYCQRPFGDPSNLNKHVRLHLQTDHEMLIADSDSVQTEITCQMCNKTLKNDKNLQRHLKLHQRCIDDDQH